MVSEILFFFLVLLDIFLVVLMTLHVQLFKKQKSAKLNVTNVFHI